MSVECFLDTNVLVYAAAGRTGEERKRRLALELIGSTEWGLSAQVLQEFYVTVVHKVSRPMAPAAALEWVRQFRAFSCASIDGDLVETAAAHAVRYRISYWDGAIVAAAEALGAPVVYSEDLNDGQRIGSVVVRNPFTGRTG